jgi:hypothetical protein
MNNWRAAAAALGLAVSLAPGLCQAQIRTFHSEAELASSLQPVPPEAVPEFGTFYFLSAQLDENLADLPLPWDPYQGSQPIYAIDLTNNVYLIADSPEDYLNQGQQSATQTLTAEAPEISGMDLGESGFASLTFEPEDLWLELTMLTNGAARLTVHPPEAEMADGVYDLYSTATLGTNWQWVLRTDPGQTDLVIENLTAGQCYFILGRTNDTDGDGLSDALEQLASHTNLNNPDENSNGIPDGWE